ncbi:MAG TPA: PstS family phosphate ABC transporter substrate-binding protein [Actinomycetota bacterium]|nr:PstS family phosphate ABC transporter substrate-binding protein [Actinomycetota bacterium]
MRKKRWVTFVVALSALAIVAAACGDDGGTTGDSALADLTGSVNVDGSSTVQPITAAVAEEFKAAGANGVKVSVGTSGTGGGFEKFCNGETDISDASRPIKDEEKAACAAKNIEYVELAVATDGLSVMVNPQNSFATSLTVDELKKIWEPSSKIKNWSQVRAGFPNQQLTLYGPGTDSGTFDYFTDEINGEEGASRSDYTASEDDNVLVQGVAGDPGALGYFGYAYYVQNKDKLKIVGIDGGSGPVVPSEQTINDGTYKPLSRPLFIYVSKSSISKPQVKAFVDFFLEEVNGLLADVGYIPLSDSDLSASKQAWTAAAA